MTQTIPVSKIVTINPGVVGTGGTPLALNGVLLTKSAIAPFSSLLQFTQQTDVANYFGINSTEAALATNYFLGFDNSTKKPGTLFIGGYAAADSAAWFRGQSLAGVTLTALQAITGSLSVTIDGSVKTYASVNLAAATSFTNAAALLTTGLGLTGSAAVTWDSTASLFQITSGTTGATSTITVPTGTAAAALGLSAGTITQGIVADTPAVAGERIAGQNGNWASFMTAWEPSLSDKTAFAVWSNGKNQRYEYIAWDTDAGYKTANNAAVFGSIVSANQYDGTVVVYNTAALAAMLMGTFASIDWNATNGRITAAFRSQAGLVATVTDNATATAVSSNNASYYGAFSAPGDGNNYNIVYDGRIGGKWKWVDSYVNQIFLNAQLQLAMFTGLMSVNSAPYNQFGYSLVRAWCTDPINQALNNGTIRAGVALSAQQKAAINAQAGLDISAELYAQGYYLQILDATAQTRGQRASPPIKLWYCDGGAIQQITLASIAVL